MEEIFLTKNAKETKKLGESFAKKLHGNEIMLLYGTLGAGKTTFVQGLAKGLGIQKRIISPTFIIMRSYELSDVKYFYHIDLYRLQSEKEIKGLGLVELMQNPKNIVVIEWPERLGAFIPKKRIEIHFETSGENERKITIKHG